MGQPQLQKAAHAIPRRGGCATRWRLRIDSTTHLWYQYIYLVAHLFARRTTKALVVVITSPFVRHPLLMLMLMLMLMPRLLSPTPCTTLVSLACQLARAPLTSSPPRRYWNAAATDQTQQYEGPQKPSLCTAPIQ